MELILTNFRGLSGSWNLGPLTLVVGGHASGKTTLLEAFQVALYGHVPRLGKGHEALAKLMVNAETPAKVELRVSTAKGETLTITRMIAVKKTAPTVSTFVRNSRGETFEDKAATTYLERLNPQTWVCDFHEFVALPPAERKRALVELIPGADDESEARAEIIKKIYKLADQLKLPEGETPKARITERLPALTAMLNFPDDIAPAKMISMLRDLKNNAETKRRKAETTAGEVSRKAADPEGLLLLAKLPDIEMNLGTVRKAIAAEEMASTMFESDRRQRAILEARRTTLQDQLKATIKEASNLANSEAVFHLAQAEVNKHLLSKPSLEEVSWAKEQAELDAARAKAASLKQKAIDLAAQHRTRSAEPDTCPHCGQALPEAKLAERQAYLDSLLDDLAQIKVEFPSLNARIAELDAHCRSEAARAAAAQATAHTWSDAHRVLEENLSKARSAWCDASRARESMPKMQAEIETIEAELRKPAPAQPGVERLADLRAEETRLAGDAAKARDAEAIMRVAKAQAGQQKQETADLLAKIHDGALAAYLEWAQAKVAPLVAAMTADLAELGVRGEPVVDIASLVLGLRRGNDIVDMATLSASEALRFAFALLGNASLQDGRRVITAEVAELLADTLQSVLAWLARKGYDQVMLGTCQVDAAAQLPDGWALADMDKATRC